MDINEESFQNINGRKERTTHTYATASVFQVGSKYTIHL